MARDRNSLSNPAYSRPGLPHNLETIVFLPLDDYFPFTHCKLTEQSSGVKMQNESKDFIILENRGERLKSAGKKETLER